MRCAVLSKRLAVPKMTEKDFQVSDQVLVRYQLEMEVSSWAELNWEFHSALYRGVDRPLLLKSIQTLHNNADRYFSSDPLFIEYWPKIEQDHRQILEACRARHVTAAVRQLLKRMTYAGSQLISHLEKGK